MKKEIWLALALIANLIIVAVGQNPTPAPQQQGPAPADDEDVVRISTNLVQVDVVVTDKNNKQVTDLRPEEFEILEDGRPQKITNFSYILADPTAVSQPVAVNKTAKPPVDKKAPPVPPVRLRPDQVRRTIALVVDDLSLSFESTYSVREALKKFVREQMQQGDLVAVIRTSAGVGALQQFTSDQRQLNAAIERVRWYPRGRGGISAFAAIESNPLAQERNSGDDPDGSGGANRRRSGRDAFGGDRERSAGDEIDEFRTEIFSVGTLGALNYIVKGLREMPGRKSIVLLSDGFPIYTREGNSSRILEALRRLTDLANRASVVVYSIDARGLQTLGLTAADDTSGLSTEQVEQRLSERRESFFASQDGLNYLAQQTGGFFIRNSNDISGGVRRVLQDQAGYYLIGYRPDESTFDKNAGGRRFHKISINIKRPGLKWRSRKGFYGIADEEARPVARTRNEQMFTALTSPFSSGNLRMRLTSLFSNHPQKGSFIRSLLFIDGRDITFTEEADGWHKGVVDVLAITFGDNGRVVDQVNRTETLRARGDTYQKILRDGMLFTLDFPVKKAGAYQMRVAIRDAPSERIGSASQFIEVPNLGKDRLAISGIALNGTDPAMTEAANKSTPEATASPAASPSADNKEGTVDYSLAQASPAVRRLRRGMDINYFYYIYNAQLDRTTRLPQLEIQVRLFREGRLMYEGKPQPYTPAQQADLKLLPAGGGMRLKPTAALGEYVLQVIVKDLLAKEKHQLATQWIDFEVVE